MGASINDVAIFRKESSMEEIELNCTEIFGGASKKRIILTTLIAKTLSEFKKTVNII